MIALAGLALADMVVALAWFEGGAAASRWLGVLHTALTLAALASLRRRSEPRGWNGLALPLGAVLGPPAILALLLIRPWSRPRSRADRTDIGARGNTGADRRKTPSTELTIARLLDERISFPRHDKVESLASILKHGPLDSRCRALQTVVRSFEPRLTPLVAMALADPDQTVRALAAATSAQISANLSDRIARAEAEPTPDIHDQYDFAMLLFEHGCNNVLLSQSQRSMLRNKARSRLTAVLRDPRLRGKRCDAAADALSQLNGEKLQHSAAQPRIVRLAPAAVAA
ncbi:hypothetical protein OLX02_03590 [Novosphingobium sp. KCTC 2891]|uniref:hypothetical protein n=1 Tax=Novosphingobium sp. KCTC 2891 TaxID=2989730 RepID=UPI0022226F24|nr:hypothetical protein [Novosphingobium sp. KCTC 2891]MCW1381897.1 hypothetical protein [Novosphingobium sp. KCTC 2891]